MPGVFSLPDSVWEMSHNKFVESIRGGEGGKGKGDGEGEGEDKKQ
jgi:hypothetical protein